MAHFACLTDFAQIARSHICGMDNAKITYFSQNSQKRRAIFVNGSRAPGEIGDYPGFDTVEMRDKIRAEIRAETKGMTDEEVREYRRLASERAELRRKARARLQATFVGSDN